MRQLIAIILLTIVSFSANAQDKGSISGKITDKAMNNDPLPFANVLIKGTSKGTTTDFDGLYELANIDPGTYTVVVSFVGYKTVEIPNVKVEAGKATKVNTAVDQNAQALEEVVITTSASRESEAALLTEQKKSGNYQGKYWCPKIG